jgi:hypothetical protein
MKYINKKTKEEVEVVTFGEGYYVIQDVKTNVTVVMSKQYLDLWYEKVNTPTSDDIMITIPLKDIVELYKMSCNIMAPQIIYDPISDLANSKKALISNYQVAYEMGKILYKWTKGEVSDKLG